MVGWCANSKISNHLQTFESDETVETLEKIPKIDIPPANLVDTEEITKVNINAEVSR